MFNALKSKTYSSKADYQYWQEKGWLDRNYYYDTTLPLGSTIVKKIIDGMVKRIVKKMGIEYPPISAAHKNNRNILGF